VPADVVVVGAGPAGLACAVRLAEAGREVRLLARGNGFTHWGAGAVDVLGHLDGERVERPLEALDRLGDGHPYRLVGADALRDGLGWFAGFAEAAGLAHAGSPEANRSQVTGLGTLRPTCLLPAPAAGELAGQGRVAVVNFAGFRDFSPALAAAGLRRAGLEATTGSAELPAWDHTRYFTAIELARAIDDAGFRRRLAPGLARAAAGAGVAVVPAVLGLAGGHEPWADLERLTGLRLVEAALPPPSVPGLRLFAAYRARMNALGVHWQFGFPAIGVERDGDRVTAVRSEGASRTVVTRCQELVLATGGVAGHGIEARRDGSLAEVVAGLPVDGFGDRMGFLADRFLGAHPLGAAGVVVDAELRPLHHSGTPVYLNVRCVGGLLAGHDPTVEGSREGVALATAARVAAVVAPAAAKP
jgi:glycerol-3-phosphate dehydrogenase subunit B